MRSYSIAGVPKLGTPEYSRHIVGEYQPESLYSYHILICYILGVSCWGSPLQSFYSIEVTLAKVIWAKFKRILGATFKGVGGVGFKPWLERFLRGGSNG